MNAIYYACRDERNFGDLFNKWLCEKLTGRAFEWTNDRGVMICGSTLQDCLPDSSVFGCGFGGYYQSAPITANIVSLRGEYSRVAMQSLGWQPGADYVGSFDPMQILPEFVVAKSGGGLGLIRHYVDTEPEQDAIDEISVCAGVDEVIDFINSHSAILTSSLHVLIAADMLGKRTALLSFGDRIATDGFKYVDYFSTAGYKHYRPIKINDLSELNAGLCEQRNAVPVSYSVTKRYIELLTNKLNQ